MSQILKILIVVFINLDVYGFDAHPFQYSTISSDTKTGHIYKILSELKEHKLILSISRTHKVGVFSNFHYIHGLVSPEKFRIDNGEIYILDQGVEKVYGINSRTDQGKRLSQIKRKWVSFK